MSRTFRLALAQINPTVGDIPGNTAKIIEYTDRARQAGADLVAFPELAITGYPPEDLLFKPSFLNDNLAAMKEVAAASQGIAVLVGYVGVEPGHVFYKDPYHEIDVSCHGGLTFSEHCAPEHEEGRHICHIVEPDESDDVWWLGFDCAHGGDRAPTGLMLDVLGHDGIYCNWQYLQRECANLARQLKEVTA